MDAMNEFVEESPGLERGLGPARGETECGTWVGHDGSVPAMTPSPGTSTATARSSC